MLRSIILSLFLFAVVSCSSNKKADNLKAMVTEQSFSGIEVVFNETMDENSLKDLFESNEIKTWEKVDDTTFLVKVSEEVYHEKFNKLASLDGIKNLSLLMEVSLVER